MSKVKAMARMDACMRHGKRRSTASPGFDVDGQVAAAVAGGVRLYAPKIWRSTTRERSLRNAYNTKDAVRIASLYAEDAELMPPAAHPITGRAPIEALIREKFAQECSMEIR